MIIRVLDFEGTTFPEDGGRVCQIGWCDVSGAGEKWKVGKPSAMLVNPGTHIISTASAVHHLIDEDVVGAPKFAESLEAFRDTSDGLIVAFASHNTKAERGFIANEGLTEAVEGMPWVCTYKAAMRLWPKLPGHSNQALRYELQLPVSRDARGHSAGHDALVTAHLLAKELRIANLSDLFEWTDKPVLQYLCRIGDWRGRPWEEVDSGFMRWCLGKDMEEDILFTCRHWIDRREAEARRQQEGDDAGDPVATVADLEQAGQRRLFG